MRVGITTKYELNDPHKYVQQAVKYLKSKKIHVDLCDKACRLAPNVKPSINFSEKYDLIMVFGGDGTLLRTIQSMKNFETPVLPMNMGRLGFYSEVLGRKYKEAIDRIVKGDYLIDSRMMLRCTVIRG